MAWIFIPAYCFAVPRQVIIFGLSLVPSRVAYNLVEERVKNKKHLQVLMGVRPSEYWLQHWLFDFALLSCVTVPGAMALFAAWDNALNRYEVWVVFELFVLALLPMIYRLSFTLTNPEAAGAQASVVVILGFAVAFLANLLPQVIDGVEQSTQDSLRAIACWISPAGGFVVGLEAIILSDNRTGQGYDPFAWSVNATVERSWDAASGTMQEAAVEHQTAALPALILFLQAVVFFGSVMWYEARRMATDPCARKVQGLYDGFSICKHRAKRVCCKKQKKKKKSEEPCVKAADKERYLREEAAAAKKKEERERDRPPPLTQEIAEDEDVRAEREAVEAERGGEGGAADPYAVRLCHLRKQWLPKGNEADGTVAVQDLCLRMRRGECFALLGTNGAGKSTTLGMLLRMFLPTAGTSYIDGTDVASTAAADGLFAAFGFCPQHNTLFEHMTGRELLTFYSALRGVPDAVRAAYVDAWVEQAGLGEYADRRCGTYSGGNKRKLSLAIALVGDPPMAVLDEPSAGVDPAARRRLWRVINRTLAQGSTISLTTHHMAEASHLGSRIGIMVKGWLTCLGSAQHLKSKYGQGYDVAVTMQAGVDADAAVALVQELCAGATVRDRPSSEYVKLSLGKAGTDFSLVALFERLELAKTDGTGVLGFVATQADLEQVFLAKTALAWDDDESD